MIERYHGHGTSEQYHSEVKTDLDRERLPSGKFGPSELVLSLGLVAYKLLRRIGQQTLAEELRLPAYERAPLPEGVFRRRFWLASAAAFAGLSRRSGRGFSEVGCGG